jgi:hypothetical protein
MKLNPEIKVKKPKFTKDMGVIMNIPVIIRDRETLDKKNTIELFRSMRH